MESNTLSWLLLVLAHVYVCACLCVHVCAYTQMKIFKNLSRDQSTVLDEFLPSFCQDSLGASESLGNTLGASESLLAALGLLVWVPL